MVWWLGRGLRGLCGGSCLAAGAVVRGCSSGGGVELVAVANAA